MRVAGKVVVVTGGANGIGRALCRRFAAEDARAIVIADIDFMGAEQVASETGGLAARTDVTDESQIQSLVRVATDRFGAIDLFCSNAGIVRAGGIESPDEAWRSTIDVNFHAHLFAARAVLPGMLARGEGYLLQTVSAAGLLTAVDSLTYSVSKHAALGFAEWLSITYADRGIRVSALCPMGVRTNMLLQSEGHFLLDGSLSPEDVAGTVIEGLAAERFLILPHPEVGEFFRRKANDYDRWLRGMRRLRARVFGEDAATASKEV